MAFLYITEFAGLDPGGGRNTQVAALPPLFEQKLAIGGEIDTAALLAKTKIVRLHTDAICHIAYVTSGNPVANATKLRMSAEATEYFAVAGGGVISVISGV